MNRRLIGPQSRPGYFGKERNIFHVPGIELRIHSYTAGRLVTIPTSLFRPAFNWYKDISIQRRTSVCTSYNDWNEATINKSLSSDLCDFTSTIHRVRTLMRQTVNVLYLLQIRRFFDMFYNTFVLKNPVS
jgi:hypothetical protein